MRNLIVEKKIKKICNGKYNDFLQYNNVIGVAKGTKTIKGKDIGEPCITVLVEKKLSMDQLSKNDLVPGLYNNIKTDVIEVGEITALSLTERIRPAKGGYSVGVDSVTAGTIGCAVYSGDGENIEHYILSNNHVLADENRAQLGAVIVQPGIADGGKVPNDVIGTLHDYEPIKFITSNREPQNVVDCAIAKCTPNIITPEICWIGYVNGISDPQKDMIVKKSGRTTALTTGKILLTNATLKIKYNTGTALFVNQIVTSGMSKGGDSGSLLLNENNEAIGLLFAGAYIISVCNPIKEVLDALNISLVIN